MTRLALGAVVLLAGGLYPVLRHCSWRLFAEREAIGEVLGLHPKIQLRQMKILDPRETAAAQRRLDPTVPAIVGRGIEMKIEVSGDGVSSLTGFRRDLKSHPVLSKTFAKPVFEVQWYCGSDRPPNPLIEVDLLLLPRGK